MKKLLIFCVMASVLVLMAGPVVADPNLYFDYNNDDVYDTSWEINGKQTVEIYLDDWPWSSPPSEPILAAQMYFYYDKTMIKVNEVNSFANDDDNGGVFDPEFSGFEEELEGGKILLTVGGWPPDCQAITDKILLWTLELESIGTGTSNIFIRVDYNENPAGAIVPGGVDCGAFHEENAGEGYATINVLLDELDDDGIPDDQDNCPNTPNGQDLGTCVNCNDGSIGSTCTASGQCSNGHCSMSQEDYDGDNIGDVCDVDTTEDNYPPPDGNNCIDACECEGDFDNDLDVDGTDTTVFLDDIGRFSSNNPCTALDPCNGDFDCDGDVDGTDTTKFLEDLGRFSFNNPCPQDCQTGDWCVY